MVTEDVPAEPLFARSGSGYTPTDRARGPWSRDVLHGSPVAALLTHCVEDRLKESGSASGKLRLARLTVDLFRPVPFAELTVAIEPRRRGRRLAVFDLTLEASGREVTRATALCLHSNASLGSVGAQFGADLPGGPDGVPVNRVDRAGNRWISYPGTLEMRHVVAPGGRTPPIVWIRNDAPVVEDVPLSGTVGAAGIADFVSPFSNMQPGRSGYLNADISLYLHREPVGEWHWLRIVSRGAAAGLATAQATIGDRTGPYGGCSAASLINP